MPSFSACAVLDDVWFEQLELASQDELGGRKDQSLLQLEWR